MSEENSKKFGDRLREIRLQKTMTQDAVAKKAKLNTNSYAKIERGVNEPSLQTIKKISEALGVKASDILGY